MPELGRLYTVESVRSVGNGFSIRLSELTPECHRGGSCSCGKCGWDAGRFRKVYRPDETMIQALHAMLHAPLDAPVPV